MSLLDKYNNAATDTGAGRARVQATSATVNGVNFTDAGPRPAGPDEFQKEFTRNPANTTTFTPGTEVQVSQGETAGLSRWYGRALNFAFTDPMETSIKDSLYKLFKNLRPDTKDSWADNPTAFHRYTQSSQFHSTLSGYAALRAKSKGLPT